MIASSPGLMVASMASKITCLPPVETMISSGLYSMPLSRLNFSQTARRSSGVPATSVYFVSPRSMAPIAASLTFRGVSKSGSPWERRDDVLALRLQRARLGRHGDGQAGLDPVEPFGGEVHGRVPGRKQGAEPIGAAPEGQRFSASVSGRWDERFKTPSPSRKRGPSPSRPGRPLEPSL